MSSTPSPDDDRKLIIECLAMVSGLSLREAKRRLGVSHTQIGEWKNAIEANTEIRPLTPRVRELLKVRLAGAADDHLQRQAKRIAAERLRQMADELEREAISADVGSEVRVTSDQVPGPGKERPEGEQTRKTGS